MSIVVKARFLAGTEINAAATEAVDLADKLGVIVEYDFNGVTCMALPGDDPESLAEQCAVQMGRVTSVKIARGAARSDRREG